MRGWGIVFIFLGVGSYILPKFGAQFALISLFGSSPYIGASFIVIGAALVVASARKA